MSYSGQSTYDAGQSAGSPAIGVPLTNPTPGQEYIASGPGRFTPDVPQMLPREFDDVTRNFGSRTYEAMLTDPAVYSSFLALKLAILAGSVQIQPKLKPKGYRYTPPNARKSSPAKSGKASGGPAKPEAESKGESGDGDEAVDPAIEKSQEVAEFCEREIARLRTPLKSTLLQMFDCMAFGVKLAEPTRIVCENGPDAGRLVLDSLKVKPEWAWNFVVDPFMNVRGIITFVPPAIAKGKSASSGGFLILPPEKFAVMTWLPRDNDPRGTSALRAAYDWWNLKQQVKPFYYAHLRRFGSPSLDGVLSPIDTANRPAINPVTGQEIAGSSLSPGQHFLSQLLAFKNNVAIVRPAGSELNVIEPNSNGEAFLNGFDLFDRQICLAIGLQARASLEAKHGSKADSDTAENTRGLIIDYGREAASDWVEKSLLYDSVAINFGKEIADEYMAEVIISDAEAQDRAELWTAAAGLGLTIGESQYEELDAELGLPERDLEADKAAAQEVMTQQAELAAKMAPPGGEKPGSTPPKGKASGAKPATKPAKGTK